MSDSLPRGKIVAGLVGAVTVALWFSCIFGPQQQRVEAILEAAAADASSVARIDATLHQAGAIRRARTDIVARLASDDRGQKHGIEAMLRLLNRDARQHSVSIVAIVPAQSSAAGTSARSAITDGPQFEISVEGTFAQIVRFVETASESNASLSIADVRLNAERRAGRERLLLAQIDARTKLFTLPR